MKPTREQLIEGRNEAFEWLRIDRREWDRYGREVQRMILRSAHEKVPFSIDPSISRAAIQTIVEADLLTRSRLENTIQRLFGTNLDPADYASAKTDYALQA